MNDELSAKLDALIEVNKQSQRWLKILAWDSAREIVETSLNEAAEYHLYEELDGETPIGDVVDSVPIPRRSVYNRLDEWQQLGIVSKEGRGKYQNLAPLGDLGMELPDLEIDDE